MLHIRRLSLALLLVAACTFHASAQKELEAGDKLFNLELYFEAVEAYKKPATKTYKEKEKNKDVKGKASFRIAECYRLANYPKLADSWYDKALKAGFSDPELHIQYARILRMNEKYDLAIEQYNAYLGLMPDDKEAKRALEGCKLAKEWKSTPSRYEVENMKSVNTKYSDYGVSFYKSNGIVFTSTREEATGKKIYGRTGEEFSDLFESYADKKGKFSDVKPLEGEVNSTYNEGASTFNKAGTLAFYTICDSKKGGCRIFMSKKQGTTWSAPETMGLFGDTITIGQPALSGDEKTLYFVATNAPGGLGGRDIWMANLGKGGGKPEAPINLGSSINTPGDEMFPYITKDNTLYFSSDYHLGMGGLDVFRSEGGGTTWITPENMKAPINSGADDFAFVARPTKDKGFMSSNREGGKGSDDIYIWKLNPLVFNVAGIVFDDSTRNPLANSDIKLLNPDDSTYQSVTTDSKGQYSFKLKENAAYQLLVSRRDYFGNSAEVSTKNQPVSKNFTIDIPLKPVPLEEITLEDILYDLDSDKLRDTSKTKLMKLVGILKTSPNLRIGINSHTDSRGSDEYNLDLSQRRAQSVVNYLIEQGIEKERLTAQGFGETKLLNRCANGVQCTEEEHQINRRTTFKVLSSDFKGIIKYKRVTGQESQDGDEMFNNTGDEKK